MFDGTRAVLRFRFGLCDFNRSLGAPDDVLRSAMFDTIEEGTIGDLRRIECTAKNLLDDGTHLFDLATFYTDAEPVEWVLAGLDYREANRWFGAHNENQAVAQWRHGNGVFGVIVTGKSGDAFDPRIALSGSDGRVELGSSGKSPLRYRSSDTTGWVNVDVTTVTTRSPSRAEKSGSARRTPSSPSLTCPGPQGPRPRNPMRSVSVRA